MKERWQYSNINSLATNGPTIVKPFIWFTPQIHWLVSMFEGKIGC